MGALNINVKVKPVSTTCELPLHRGFDDPSNPCTEDIVITGGTAKFRLRTVDVNGDDASADTAVIKRCWIARLGPSYVAGTDLTGEPVCHLSRTPGDSATVDMQAFKLGSDGVASGGDRVETAAIDISAVTTPTKQSFVIDGTGLVPGDRVLFIDELSIDDDGVAGGSVDMFGYLDRMDIGGSSRGGFVFVEV